MNISSKAQLKVPPSTIICVESEIRGDVKIGNRNIVHPFAKIHAINGPIIIGDENIFEEHCLLENRSTTPLIVGNQNSFEVKSIVRAWSIGDNNVFSSKCVVGEMVTVGNSTTFGASTVSNPAIPHQPQDFSVFFGTDPTRHRIASQKNENLTDQVDYLSKALPNFHFTLKSSIPKPTSTPPGSS